jgi:hypothetical protein
MTNSYSDTLDELLGVPFSHSLILVGLDRCESLDDDSQCCLYASIIAGSIATANPQLEEYIKTQYMPALMAGRKPKPHNNIQSAGDVLLPTCIGDVMKSLGRTPKTDLLDGLDIWDDEDLAMLKKVWSGI